MDPRWLHIKLVIYLVLLINQVCSESTLKQLHIAFRHGERSPTETFPNDPYVNFTWLGGLGQLTNRGKLQLYTLGNNIRSEYGTFIPKTYWNKYVKVTSSYSERCLMSAQLFCAGLYPPTGSQIWSNELLWQPIPINYAPRLQDRNIAMKAPCEKYDEIFKEIRQTPEIAAIENEYQDLKTYLTEHSGKNITNIEDVEFLFNTLEIEQLQNFTMPKWVNDSMMATMKQLGARNLALYTETQYMKKMKGGVFVSNVITSMENILNGTDETKLYLYAVHDTTLVNILRSLDLIDTLKPDYAATLVFELYADGEVKITYRNFWKDNPAVFVIPRCQTPCSLKYFKSSLNNVLPVDYNKECELDSKIASPTNIVSMEMLWPNAGSNGKVTINGKWAVALIVFFVNGPLRPKFAMAFYG